MGTGGVVWQDLIVAGTIASNALGFGFWLSQPPDPNLPIEAYSHVIDGEKQPGVYLGSGNVTNFGFNYIRDSDLGEFYYLRLLVPGSNNLATGKSLNNGEFEGYVRIGS
jgi:hypothetical protein